MISADPDFCTVAMVQKLLEPHADTAVYGGRAHCKARTRSCHRAESVICSRTCALDWRKGVATGKTLLQVNESALQCEDSRLGSVTGSHLIQNSAYVNPHGLFGNM